MPEWTTQQNDAINARGRNILVSAAAGSGKTAVLVERVIKKITDNENPVDIDKLLIVTFTNNAAAEIAGRKSSTAKKIPPIGELNDPAIPPAAAAASNTVRTRPGSCR